MSLNTEESKSVAVRVWERINALPGHSFSSRAFDKIVAQEFRKAELERLNHLNPIDPVRTPA